MILRDFCLPSSCRCTVLLLHDKNKEQIPTNISIPCPNLSLVTSVGSPSREPKVSHVLSFLPTCLSDHLCFSLCCWLFCLNIFFTTSFILDCQQQCHFQVTFLPMILCHSSSGGLLSGTSHSWSWSNYDQYARHLRKKSTSCVGFKRNWVSSKEDGS